MQTSVIATFESNPSVEAVLLDQGGFLGESRAWLEEVWSRFYLRGRVIFDATGTTAQLDYAQPSTGLPFARYFIIDQQGDVSLPYFGHDARKAIDAINALLTP